MNQEEITKMIMMISNKKNPVGLQDFYNQIQRFILSVKYQRMSVSQDLGQILILTKLLHKCY